MWTQYKWWNWFRKSFKTEFMIYPLHWSDMWKLYPKLSMYNWDTAVCVCVCVYMVGTKKRDGSSRKLIFARALSPLQSFIAGANWFPGSVATLWDMGSPFYSKLAVTQWTHPSSLRATKCKVCQYAGRLLHLHSMLQETLALYSYFEIQKWMWSYAVTCHADCIRLLAGRGKNMCHEVWSLSTVIPIYYTTITRCCCILET